MSGFAREIAVVRDGVATPFTGNDPATGTFRGCLYTAEGERLALSQRPGGAAAYRFSPGDPDRIDPESLAAAPRLAGRTLYLGHYLAHYGHFLTETLSSFWILGREPAAAFDRVAFHPAGFGRRLTAYARACLAAFDIDPDRLLLLDPEGLGGAPAVRFEEVVVPERLFRLWDAADPLLAEVYARIRDRMLAGRAPLPPRALYITRRASYWRSTRRIVANEVRVEALFRRRGFLAIDPAGMAFADQLALYAAAPTIAGLSGSALHNSLFQRPGARLIEIEHPSVYRDALPVHTQDLCNAVAGVAGSFVPFTGARRHGGAVLHVDLPALEAALEAALPPAAPEPAGRRLAAALETRALDLLPPVRAAAGRARAGARQAAALLVGMLGA